MENPLSLNSNTLKGVESLNGSISLAIQQNFVIMAYSGQSCQENSEAPGQERKTRPPVSEVSRKFSGPRN